MYVELRINISYFENLKCDGFHKFKTYASTFNCINNMMLACKESELWMISFFCFSSDQKIAQIDRKLMAYKLLRFQNFAK